MHGSFEHAEMVKYGIPQDAGKNILVVMPIEIAGVCDLAPRNIAMTCLYFIGQATRCLGDNLQATSYRIERALVRRESLIGNALNETMRQGCVVRYRPQDPFRILRRHRPRLT